ncbi:hypothetical protein [Palleronia caenipelagi]|uniref:Uncharacterized protein n=1 Tax=Palleronia caenipelagi TaxID=2489174 RepID=A0A547PM52_9RHOB|nr:hypothetical protein [Palleronia caenipelagi]TRD15228.1 hypothetical protein FEV53_17315 [Palleronia caenipelagi]
MHVAPANLDEILTWFEDRRNNYNCLIFYLSDGAPENVDIESLIENRHRIDHATRKKTAFLVIDHSAESAVELVDNPHRIFIPGAALFGDSFAERSKGIGLFDSPHSQFKIKPYTRISDLKIDADAVSRMRDATTGFCGQVIEKYQIDIQLLPALVLLTKGDAEPVVIGLKRGMEADKVLTLLDDISSLEEEYSDSWNSLRKVKDEDSSSILEKSIEEDKKTLDRYAKRFSDLTSSAEFSPAAQAIVERVNSDALWDAEFSVVDLVKKVRVQSLVDRHEMDSLLGEEHFSRLCKQFDIVLHRYQGYAKQIQLRINGYENTVKDLISQKEHLLRLRAIAEEFETAADKSYRVARWKNIPIKINDLIEKSEKAEKRLKWLAGRLASVLKLLSLG